MTKKLLVARLGAGSITIALCAALPGCNLALVPSEECVGHPSSRGNSFVVCGELDGAQPDRSGDATTTEAGRAIEAGQATDVSPDSSCDAVADTGRDLVSGDAF